MIGPYRILKKRGSICTLFDLIPLGKRTSEVGNLRPEDIVINRNFRLYHVSVQPNE